MEELDDEDAIKEYIEANYVVPLIVDANSNGDIFIEFSDRLKPLAFEELAAKFLVLG